MKRWDLTDFRSSEPMEETPNGDWVRFEDHEAIIKRQAAAATSGMDATTRISSRQLELARQARAESAPEALESERAANARLTQEVEDLRNELTAARLENENAKHDIERLMATVTSEANEVERLRNRVWALAFLWYPDMPPREAIAGDIGWPE